MKRIVIVTGASSGLGAMFVAQIIAEKDKKLSFDQLWIVARRGERLATIKAAYPNIDIKIILCDMGSREAIDKELTVDPNLYKVVLLVNNAGIGKYGLFEEASQDANLSQIHVNISGLTQLTHKVLPAMGDKSGIINVASSAAFLPQSKFAVYGATKSYVVYFTKALQREVAGRGIHLLAVCPGPVRTEFFEHALNNSPIDPLKAFFMVEAKDVVALALKDYHRKRHLSVYGLPMKVFKFFSGIIPPNSLLG